MGKIIYIVDGVEVGIPLTPTTPTGKFLKDDGTWCDPPTAEGGGLTEGQVQALIDTALNNFITTFEAHTHNYRKITQLGVDGAGDYGSPVRISIEDDTEVDITDSNKVASVGITVATQASESPNP